MKVQRLSKLQKTLAQYQKPEVLFRPISKAVVSFDPFDSTSESARHFLSHICARKVQKSLPNLIAEVVTYQKGEPPMLSLDYDALVDGTKQVIATSSLTIFDILRSIERESRWKGENMKTPEQLMLERRRKSSS
eukprot:jgi/Galph1/624/GphlegSOOS_G5416.1